MTTVAQLVKYLQTLDQDLDVKVLSGDTVGTYWVDVDLDDTYSDNVEVVYDSLYLGGE